MVLAGGYDGENYTASTDIFDVQTGKIQQPETFISHILNHVLFSHKSGTWRTTSDFPIGQENCASVEYGGGLVVIGGNLGGDEGQADTFYFFDPADEIWRDMALR